MTDPSEPGDKADPASPTAEDVDLAVVQARWEAGDPIVDVRSAQEYAGGHIAGAINVPLDSLGFRAADLPAGEIVTACSMGTRSRQGAERLCRLGRSAVSLRGGTKAWAAAGLPIATGPEPGDRRRTATDPLAWFRGVVGRFGR